MAMPRKLKNLNLFNDGNSYLGVVKSVTLPPLGRKMEAYRGGGMNGSVKADLGFSDDGIQFEWKTGGIDLIALRQFGSVNASGIMLRFSGAFQQDDTGDVSTVEVVVRGRHETIEMGDASPGEDTEHSITTTCSYYKLTVDNEDIIEIDLLNFIEKVNGVDMLEKQRQALGI
ncbi:phage major tail tube protein [Pseudomonas protegens]|uniref:Major tail tube protein FII n=1 Tax=Pseudomonas protegens (strain DSM 19095 / LMG 27888 / CFBP 6595 / CHA0) TaxID=1124983 RepID=A0A2C9EJJ1_PSEPH|nr:phage major tail tube protein [Pseudomonas protegens]AGL83830.1 major tail tube protein FII [Pseudomonas protegens CHA0]MBP5108650.1 phage major tail tube protein [Pseudomonas protegens]QTU24698.1 phage major tail tube protein [Pseudomonas protegens]QTU34227.1 phage major tail tube protein [Pseudomonas protegens]RLO20596.1 phage major tail tube protein [Pseudomonas protegens]